ncbi:hypothetical protein GGI10_004851 [Coemansia sp. RSA 2530]|nr:hypothetical protein GGI10_004851 [Coemansia sp. RSA 2530]
MQQLTLNIVDENGVWERIEGDFTSRLPLRNLIWKGGLTQSARFIEQLDVKVTVGESDSVSSYDTLALASEQTGSGRLLNMYLLESDSEADTYKAVIKPRVKAWVGRVSQRKGEEWMIVYVASPEEIQRMSNSKFLSMRTSVFDKLKSDFQGKKDAGEHVVQLQMGSVENWNSLFLAMRERVVLALEERVSQLADEMRRMDANRMLPGWNYCKFFVLKEGVVRLYRLMGLLDEALAQYDELEAVFFQLLGAQRLSWFSTFGGLAEGDDYSDVLDTGKRAYGRQLVETTISLFDFRMYLFGRQAQLLVAQGHYGELADRAQRFIATFGRSMREPGTGLSPAFVAAWTYSSCMNIAEILEGAPASGGGSVRADGGTAMRALAAAKAGFLAGARQQLDVLGALWKRLPGGGDADGLPAVANPVLAAALATDERFDQIYVRTCEQAAQYYVESGRRRFARAMYGNVARLLASRGQWAGAARLLRTLVPGKDEPLSSLDVAALERLAGCERQLGNAHDSLECVVRLIAQAGSDNDRAYATMLSDLCGVLWSEQGGKRQRMAGDLFSVLGAKAVARSDTLCVEALVSSRVATDVRVDRVAAVLSCGSGHRLEVEFVARDVTLTSGEATVMLTADAVSCAGRFSLAAVSVAIGGAEFVAATKATLSVDLAEHPANPTVRLLPALVADIGSPALRVAVSTRATSVAAGMAIRLFDAGSGAPLKVTRCDHAGFLVSDGVIVTTDAMDSGHSSEADVELGTDPLAQPPKAVTVCALHKTAAGEQRVFVGTTGLDMMPALDISAHAVALGDNRVAVILRSRCTAANSLRLESLLASVPDTDWALEAEGAVMRHGDAVSAVREITGDALELRLVGEARFSSLAEDANDLRLMRFNVPCSPAGQAVAVHMTAGSGFCRVLEPTPLSVRIRIVGPATAARVRVTVTERDGPAQWLIAGAVDCEVDVGGSEVLLEYSLVALGPGFLRLPEVVCYEGGLPLQTLVDADFPTICAVPNHGAMAVYSVPVVVRN